MIETLRPDFKLEQFNDQKQENQFESRRQSQSVEKSQNWYRNKNGQRQTRKKKLSGHKEKKQKTALVNEV